MSNPFDDSNSLQLNVTKRCKDRCTCTPHPEDIQVSEENPVPNTKDFISCTHKSSTPFLLQQVLGSGENELPNYIPSVTSVTTYYWEKEENKPLFLGVITQSEEKPQYYYKYAKGEDEAKGGDVKTWTSDPNLDTPLEERLDDRNCGVNKAIVYDLKNGYSGSSDSTTNSTCRTQKRKITSVQSSITPPLGGNYTVKEYEIKSEKGDTRISRVEYGKGVDTKGITPPNEPVTKIRVYYWKHKEVPLLIEFVKSDGTESDWFENTDKASTQWKPVGPTESQKFYDGTGIKPQPQDALTTKLDEVNCNVNNVVQINVTEQPTKTYCHDHAKDDHANRKRISVNDATGTYATGLPTYKVYSHTPNNAASWEGTNPYKFIVSKFKNKNGELTGIITSPSKPYIPDVTKVLVYFCSLQSDDPLLIYYEQKTSDEETSTTHHWYKEGSGAQWTSAGLPISTDPDQHTKILEQLDKIRSPCQVPSVTIDIKNGPDGSRTYNSKDSSGARKGFIEINEEIVEKTSNYKSYTHKVQGNTRDYFTVQKVTYGQNITTIAHPTPIEKVTAFNVYYWEPLGEYGNPLLIKIEKDGHPKEEWYENKSQNTNNDNWHKINDPSHVSGENLKSKLILLNCHLNGVTVIDIGRSLISAPSLPPYPPTDIHSFITPIIDTSMIIPSTTHRMSNCKLLVHPSHDIQGRIYRKGPRLGHAIYTSRRMEETRKWYVE